MSRGLEQTIDRKVSLGLILSTCQRQILDTVKIPRKETLLELNDNLVTQKNYSSIKTIFNFL